MPSSQHVQGYYDSLAHWKPSTGGVKDIAAGTAGVGGQLAGTLFLLVASAIGFILGWREMSAGGAFYVLAVGGVGGLLVGIPGYFIVARIVNNRLFGKRMAVLQASREGNLAGLEALFQGTANAARGGDWRGVTALHVVKDRATAELLLANGAEMDAATHDGWDATSYAIFDQRFDVADLLRQRGAKLPAASVFLGIRERRSAEFALRLGISPSARAPDLQRPCPGFFAVADDYPIYLLATRQRDDGAYLPYTGYSKELPGYVLEGDNGSKSYRIGGGYTPLHLAVGAGREEVVAALLAAGAGVNARGSVGFTPLHNATTPGEVSRLLAAGADLKAAAWSDLTPLHLAVLRGRVEVVRELLSHGADPFAAVQLIANNRTLSYCVVKGRGASSTLGHVPVGAALLATGGEGEPLAVKTRVLNAGYVSATSHLHQKFLNGSTSPECQPDEDGISRFVTAFDMVDAELSKLTALALLRDALAIPVNAGDRETAVAELRSTLAAHKSLPRSV